MNALKVVAGAGVAFLLFKALKKKTTPVVIPDFVPDEEEPINTLPYFPSPDLKDGATKVIPTNLKDLIKIVPGTTVKYF